MHKKGKKEREGRGGIKKVNYKNPIIKITLMVMKIINTKSKTYIFKW